MTRDIKISPREYLTADEQLRMAALGHAMKLGHIKTESVLKSAREFEEFLRGAEPSDGGFRQAEAA